MEVKKVPGTGLGELKIFKRAVIYARVSHANADNEHSLDAQVTGLESYIHNKPELLYKGSYKDYAISGTKEDRPSFQQMMEDARKHKFDLIVTKTVSRFARNVVALLKSVRELKDLGISVYFVADNLYSDSPEGELHLTMLAMYAEEQARSASENKRWQIKRDFEKGKPSYLRPPYGYRWEDRHLIVVPEEAEIVQKVFELYLSGLGAYRIAKYLEEHFPKDDGKSWTEQTISGMLKNEKYIGDMLLQKTFTPDFRTKKQCVNKGELRQYYVENSHEAIISKETFARVQKEREQRYRSMQAARQQSVRQNKSRIKPDNLFKGLIRCEHCGATFTRKHVKLKSAWTYHWVCNTYAHHGKERCFARRIHETDLIQTIKQTLNFPEKSPLTSEAIRNSIEKIIVTVDGQLIVQLHGKKR